jgi:hypothetical protein
VLRNPPDQPAVEGGRLKVDVERCERLNSNQVHKKPAFTLEGFGRNALHVIFHIAHPVVVHLIGKTHLAQRNRRKTQVPVDGAFQIDYWSI